MTNQTVMTLHTDTAPASAALSTAGTLSSFDTRSTSETRSTGMNLLKEALSRARTRSPQNEASRSARLVAIQARRQQARDLGDVSQFVVR